MSGLITPYGIRSAKAAGFGVFALCGVSVLFFKWKKKSMLKKKALEVKQKLMLAIQRQLEQFQNEEADEKERILVMDAVSLIAAAQNGNIDPVIALKAYMYKACSATKNLNCVTGIIETAENVAVRLDASQAKQCLLYGLPVSLKESIETKGMDSTIGLAQFIDSPAKDDAVLVKVLKHCGAVPFVKTNLSQMMFSFESSNPIFGATVNPHNLKFTPGGSSSGEGALIAAGGSLLGFGTDTGGSIRCPAHMCGVYGFKPSLNRISEKGLKGLPGRIGPIARDMDTIVLAMRALLCPLMFELDVDVPPLPFNEKVFGSTRKLRIGYYVDDGYNEPAPSIKRGVIMAKEALEKVGHILVPFTVPRPADAMRLFFAEIFSDGYEGCRNILKYEQIDPILQRTYMISKLPEKLRWIISALMGLKWSRIAQSFYLYGGGDKSVLRLRKLQAEAYAYKQDFHNAWLNEKLDAVVCPPFVVAAGPLRCLENTPVVMGYTGLYNFLNFPAGIVPVTKVEQSDIDALRNYRGHYGDPWDKHIKKTSELSLGMPVGVQCVALPFQDEMSLRVMKEVQSALS
ncbi:unnamed protein product [Clavelina lepadiformis]|uniref:Amidase domain-containing protein n=1 Tax=Clavelina lepadiformis TaxID=159417 RepID=A0ABP0F6F6_CLALP